MTWCTASHGSPSERSKFLPNSFPSKHAITSVSNTAKQMLYFDPETVVSYLWSQKISPTIVHAWSRAAFNKSQPWLINYSKFQGNAQGQLLEMAIHLNNSDAIETINTANNLKKLIYSRCFSCQRVGQENHHMHSLTVGQPSTCTYFCFKRKQQKRTQDT